MLRPNLNLKVLEKKTSNIKNLWLLPGTGGTGAFSCGGAVATDGCIPIPGGEYGGSEGSGTGYL